MTCDLREIPFPFPRARTSTGVWHVKQKDEKPSRSHTSVSIASCSQWKVSCGGEALTMFQKKKETKKAGVDCVVPAECQTTGGSRTKDCDQRG